MLDKMTEQEQVALIAEKVMGWEIISEHEDLKRAQRCDYENGIAALYGKHYVARGKGKSRGFWNPWTDIGAAWEVFELSLDPNRTSLHPVGNGQTGLSWQICHDDVLVAQAKTAPEAICLAALLSVGAIVDYA